MDNSYDDRKLCSDCTWTWLHKTEEQVKGECDGTRGLRSCGIADENTHCHFVSTLSELVACLLQTNDSL